MSKLLVIGSGLLGREVAFAARDRHQTVLTYNNHPVEIDGCKSYQMDVTRCINFIQFMSPDYIVLTAAMTNVDACEADRLGAWNANAVGPKKVALAARDIGAKLIYVSTDYVFDGEMGMYREDDLTTPINYYGESKLAGESFVQETLEDYAIARTSVLYGWNPVRLNFVTWAIQELKSGNKINIINDQYNSPTLSSNLAEMVLSLRDETGIFHTAGSERINRYDFSLKIARAFKLDESLVIPITSDALSWKARRPKDSSLDVSLVSNISKPLNVEEGLKSMVKMAEQEKVTQ